MTTAILIALFIFSFLLHTINAHGLGTSISVGLTVFIFLNYTSPVAMAFGAALGVWAGLWVMASLIRMVR